MFQSVMLGINCIVALFTGVVTMFALSSNDYAIAFICLLVCFYTTLNALALEDV